MFMFMSINCGVKTGHTPKDILCCMYMYFLIHVLYSNHAVIAYIISYNLLHYHIYSSLMQLSQPNVT